MNWMLSWWWWFVAGIDILNAILNAIQGKWILVVIWSLAALCFIAMAVHTYIQTHPSQPSPVVPNMPSPLPVPPQGGTGAWSALTSCYFPCSINACNHIVDGKCQLSKPCGVGQAPQPSQEAAEIQALCKEIEVDTTTDKIADAMMDKDNG